MDSELNTGATSETSANVGVETLPVPVDEFALTTLLRAINAKLKDGIAGVMQRAYRVFKAFIIFIKDLIVHLVVDGIPWLCRLVWNILKFIFGRKMFNLVKENIILFILLPAFLASLAWPFAVYYFRGEEYWQWIGWAWLVFIGLVGAWIGFKTGLYSKWIKIVKARRANKKAARASEATAEADAKAEPTRQDEMKG